MQLLYILMARKRAYVNFFTLYIFTDELGLHLMVCVFLLLFLHLLEEEEEEEEKQL